MVWKDKEYRETQNREKLNWHSQRVLWRPERREEGDKGHGVPRIGERFEVDD